MPSIDLESDRPDFEAEQQLREDAGEMRGHYFRGERLQPFSIARQLAFARLIQGGETNALEAALALIFICTKERDDIEAARTPEGKKAFRLEMETWADGHKIGLTTQSGKDVIKLSDTLWAELEASEGEPKPTADQKPKGRSPNASRRRR